MPPTPSRPERDAVVVQRARAREPPAEPVQSAQNGALKPDRNARHKELGLVRSRGGQTQGTAPSLGVQVAGAIQSKRALDEALEAQRWAELDDHLDCVFARRSDGVRLTGRSGDRPAGAEHTPDSAAQRENRAADDLDALLLSRMDVKWRRRCVAPHPEVEAQQLAARTHGVGQARDPLPHRWGFDRFLKTHRSRTLSRSDCRRQANARQVMPATQGSYARGAL